MPTPPTPERIRTDRLVLRCWQPADAPLLKAAIDGSLEHLREYMTWARHEPTSIERFVTRIERWGAEFRGNTDWRFGIFPPDEDEVLGAVALHPPTASTTMSLGYWLRHDAVGRGYMTEAVGALTRLALGELGAERVVIFCDERNVRSAGVARRLGYRLARTYEEAQEGGPPCTMLAWEAMSTTPATTGATADVPR